MIHILIYMIIIIVDTDPWGGDDAVGVADEAARDIVLEQARRSRADLAQISANISAKISANISTGAHRRGR